jgi:ferredoxin--NADP+ reductase
MVMNQPDSTVRVAIVGAGPAGFYAAEHLLKQSEPAVEVDLFDRLPTPHGLVRAGVAPDHDKIKNVTRVFDKTAARDGFRFFGNVEFGRDITLDDVRRHYHFVCFCTGAQVDRSLGIPGEDLPRSHSATEFVAWYNGHPDFRDLTFDLSQERVVVIGVGNVAVDVARILCRTVDELRRTDIADHALEVLAESRVREVLMVGRRGPAQAAFTLPEIKEMGELEAASARTFAEEIALDPHSAAALEANPDRATTSILEVLRSYEGGSRPGAARECQIRFLLSPIELLAGPDGGVSSIRLVRNRLEPGRGGRLSAVPTDEIHTWPAGLVFRSVGYRGVALPDVPFRDDWGVIHNEKGRVISPDGRPVSGVYAAGWIKRGPSGVIGTNKPDAVETAECILADWTAGIHFHPDAGDIRDVLDNRGVPWISYSDWLRLDEMERKRGESQGRPRLKFTRTAEMLAFLGRH